MDYRCDKKLVLQLKERITEIRKSTPGITYTVARTQALKEFRISGDHWSIYCSALGEISGQEGGKKAAKLKEQRREQDEKARKLFEQIR
jgi:hypothetical protein